MKLRTDLAIETREMSGTGTLDGVIEEHESKTGLEITRIKIVDERGEQKLSKPKGTYVTIEIPPLTDYSENERMEHIAYEIRNMLPESGLILIAGLGNFKITPDALGPKTASLIFATRHIQGEIARSSGLENLRPVAVLAPGVLGQTGMETGEIISSLCQKLNPSAVIVVDAMASRRMTRLGTTIQICDSGISPGSGVGNMRPQLNRETLGVPVIALGVPTVNMLQV